MQRGSGLLHIKISDPHHGEQTANKWRITGGRRQYWADKLSPASVCVSERGAYTYSNACCILIHAVPVCVCVSLDLSTEPKGMFLLWTLSAGMVLSQTLPEREGERGGEGWTSAGFQFIKKCCWCFRPQIRATAAINLTHPFHHRERQTALIAVVSPRLSHNTSKYPQSPNYYCSWNSILSVYASHCS